MSTARTDSARFVSASLASAAAHATPEPFLAWVVAIWFTGATAFSLRLLGGWILAERLRRTMIRPASAEWQRKLNRLKTRASISQPVRLLVSGALHAPAAIGWLRPIVLVPAGALTGMPAAQIEAILVHELAHIRRHDYLVPILQSAIEIVFFYHPAV
jgi:beta-lactamase regulating signal transducer with metallopeptidase domain